MTFHCFHCARVFTNADDLPGHNCRATTRRQTEHSTTRVSDKQWSEISARLAHPSAYTPDGAA